MLDAINAVVCCEKVVRNDDADVEVDMVDDHAMVFTHTHIQNELWPHTTTTHYS